MRLTVWSIFSGCRYLYYTIVGENPQIERSLLDGTNRTVLVNTGHRRPAALAIDFANGDLYWADSVAGSIQVNQSQYIKHAFYYKDSNYNLM